MRDERLIRTLLLAVAGLALFAWLRPASMNPINDDVAAQTEFFINKIHSDRTYDLVVVGDSRALRGISPEEMEDVLGDLSVLNYSFHAGGLNNEMYDAAQTRLDPDSGERIILLAVTSLSLMPFKEANEQYHEYKAKPVDQVLLYRHAPALAKMFQPLEASVFIRRWLSLKPPLILSQTFHESGWIESSRTPDNVYEDLDDYGRRIRNFRVSRRLIGDLADRVRLWSDQGVRVFGFFPPAMPARTALEDSILGFSPPEFIETFESAGGVWLDIENTGYHVYDGSHLDATSARKLSRTVARDIAARL